MFSVVSMAPPLTVCVCHMTTSSFFISPTVSLSFWKEDRFHGKVLLRVSWKRAALNWFLTIIYMTKLRQDAWFLLTMLFKFILSVFSTVTTLCGSGWSAAPCRRLEEKQQLKTSGPMASCYIAATISTPSGTPEHQTSMVNLDTEACRDPGSQQGAAAPGMEKHSVALTSLKMLKVKVLLLFLTSRWTEVSHDKSHFVHSDVWNLLSRRLQVTWSHADACTDGQSSRLLMWSHWLWTSYTEGWSIRNHFVQIL